MQYIVLAYDYLDPESYNRRINARPAHLELAEEMHHSGKWLFASAILNQEGKMAGSMIVCEFESEEEVKTYWFDREPYIQQDVWETIEIIPAMVAPSFLRKH